MLYKFIVVASLAASSLAQYGYGPPAKKCPCFTASTTVDPPQSKCKFITTTCIRPLCVFLTTTTVPAKNPRCPVTPTRTITRPCYKSCPGGCGTFTETETASTTCLKPTPTTTKKPSSTPCYTATTHITQSPCKPIPDCFTADCIIDSTVLVPAGQTACPTTKKDITTCPKNCGEAGGCKTNYVTGTALSSRAAA